MLIIIFRLFDEMMLYQQNAFQILKNSFNIDWNIDSHKYYARVLEDLVAENQCSKRLHSKVQLCSVVTQHNIT